MLYIVATPIGNLGDLSLRQAKILSQSDIILAEDTRSALIIINFLQKQFNYGFKSVRIISYYKEKEMDKLPEIIEYLKQNKTISLISESGMPLISDPGYLLIKICIKENLKFAVIPGPSAVTTALAYSGLKLDKFMFLGYFPKKQSHIIQLINQLDSIRKICPEIVFVLFESPHRINRTLQCFEKLKWPGNIVICREMTKKFEEIIRGKASELVKRNYKGEITILFK